jgi:hypothetical protein
MADGRHSNTGSPKAVNASEEFLGQRDDDARRASHGYVIYRACRACLYVWTVSKPGVDAAFK